VSTSRAEDPDVPVRPPPRRWLVAILSVLIVLVASGTAFAIARSRSTPRFCTADGLISDQPGVTYHRDPDQGCKFVDQNGNPPPSQ
jgi:hypothetical protein